METCKDCLSYEACESLYRIAFKENINYAFTGTCKHFKNKADFVEVKHGCWQIEEMANEIYKTLMLEADCSLSGTDCECIANLLIAKGYRKTSDAAREIFEEIEETIANLEYRVNNQKNTPFNIGRIEEIKSEVNRALHEVVPQILAELKKKYTEVEK